MRSRPLGPLLMGRLLIGLLLAGASICSAQSEPVIGLPCQGCDEVFIGMPDELSSAAVIAAADEPGTRLRIDGTVRDSSGKPAAGVIVYAYQTDAQGIYPSAERGRGKTGSRHGLLRAWARTDKDGHYRFDSIRPASYPNTRIPQHVHMHVIEPGCCTYYIADILFSDDPLLTASSSEGMASGRGGNGLVTPILENGELRVRRDIVLGAEIAGHPSVD